MRRRRHLLTTLFIGLLWTVVLVIVGYEAWAIGSPYDNPLLGDPFAVGVIFGLAALALTYVLLRSAFPSESARAARWRKLAELVDEMDERDLDLLRHQLASPAHQLHDDEAMTIEELLQAPRRKLMPLVGKRKIAPANK